MERTIKNFGQDESSTLNLDHYNNSAYMRNMLNGRAQTELMRN